MYNNACTVVIALQTAFPCPVPVADRTTANLYAAFISEFRTSMMYRPNVYGDDYNKTNLRAPPTMGDTRVLYVFDSQTDFSHSLLIALVPARENRLGANTNRTLAHNAHIICIYVNNVIYCITRVRRLMWTYVYICMPRNYKHNVYYYKTFCNNKLHPVIRVNDDDQTTSQLPSLIGKIAISNRFFF